MNHFERQILHCANVRTPISAHCHIKGGNQATAQCGRGFQECAGRARSANNLERDRTLPVSPPDECVNVRLPRRAHCHIANVRPLDAPHIRRDAWV